MSRGFHLDKLPVPDALRQKQTVDFFGGWASVGATIVAVIGLASINPFYLGLHRWRSSEQWALSWSFLSRQDPQFAEFNALKYRCDEAHARLHGDSFDPSTAQR